MVLNISFQVNFQLLVWFDVCAVENFIVDTGSDSGSQFYKARLTCLLARFEVPWYGAVPHTYLLLCALRH